MLLLFNSHEKSDAPVKNGTTCTESYLEIKMERVVPIFTDTKNSKAPTKTIFSSILGKGCCVFLKFKNHKQTPDLDPWKTLQIDSPKPTSCRWKWLGDDPFLLGQSAKACNAATSKANLAFLGGKDGKVGQLVQKDPSGDVEIVMPLISIYIWWEGYPPGTNIAHENRPTQKESHVPTSICSGAMLVCGSINVKKPVHLQFPEPSTNCIQTHLNHSHI